MKAHGLWFLGANQFSIREETLRSPSTPYCVVKSICSGISQGTEQLVYSEAVPESIQHQMRCPYMGGDFPFPIKYGYSLVGEVVEGPENIVGRNVHMLHPHQDYGCVHPRDIYLLDDGILPEKAILASNMETAVNAVWDSQVTLGDRVLVVGFGNVGSLVARILSLSMGVEMFVTDTSALKRSMAQKMGFNVCEISQLKEEFDISFNVSASADGLQTAIDAVGYEGKIIELSWYGNRAVSLQLGGDFHIQRKTIISSQVSHIPSHRLARWDTIRRKKLVFSLLKQPEFEEHVTHNLRFSELPRILSESRSLFQDNLMIAVHYDAI